MSKINSSSWRKSENLCIISDTFPISQSKVKNIKNDLWRWLNIWLHHIILAYVLHYVAAQRACLSVDKYSFCCFQQVEQSLWKQDPPGPETFSMWQQRASFWLVWLSFNLKLKLGICDWKFMLTLLLSCKCHFRGIFNYHHIIFIIYVWWTDDDLYRHYNTTYISDTDSLSITVNGSHLSQWRIFG